MYELQAQAHQGQIEFQRKNHSQKNAKIMANKNALRALSESLKTFENL